MKKILALLLALVMILSLCACGEDPYAEYEHINQMLANGDYDGAINAINALKKQSQDDNAGDHSGNQQGSSTNTTAGKPDEPEKPTDEEEDLIKEYERIFRGLRNYAEQGRISVKGEDGEYVQDNEALAYCYQKLQDLAVIDKWLQADEWVDSDVDTDREKLLAGFYKVPDVQLYMHIYTTDNMGNVGKSPWDTIWSYNRDGSVSVLEDHTRGLNDITYLGGASGGYANYEYDASGRVIKLWFGTVGNVNSIVTYTYDASGKLTAMHEKANTYEYDYSVVCDGNGNITEISWRIDKLEYKLLYTYDAAGRLINEEKHCNEPSNWLENTVPDQIYTMTYTYDSNGHLASGVYCDQNWGERYSRDENGEWTQKSYLYSERVDSYTYTCDEKGRVTRVEVVPGNTYYRDGEKTGEIYQKPNYALRVFETVYGDYYQYIPAA